VPWAALRL